MGTARCGGGRRNTLGLSPREIESMLDRMDSDGAAGNPSTQREFTRWRYRIDNVNLLVIHPGGSLAEFPVVCRNLSCGGVGLLHASYLHPGSAVRVVLPHPDKGDVTIKGMVRRCLHRGGKVHDVGIQFDEPLSVRDFVGLDLLCDTFSREVIDPDQLEGTVLHIEPSKVDQGLVSHFLRGTRIKLKQVDDGKAGLVALTPETNLVLISEAIEHPTPAELVAQIRSQGSTVALVITAPSDSPEIKTAALAMRLDAMISKPIKQDLLLRAVAEFTLHSSTSDAANQLESQAGTVPLPKRLSQLGCDLSAALGLEDVPRCISLCEQIRALAQQGGLESIVPIAGDAAEELALSKSIEKSIRSLLNVVGACDDLEQSRAA